MQVTLKVKDNEGNIKKEQHEIEGIDLFQFEQMMKVIKDVFVELQKDESLSQLFKDLFDGQGEDEDMDAVFIQNIVNSFETLALKLPNQAFRLLSILSGIEFDTLRKQKMLDAFDIFDAVVEENDLERLWKRAKKSLATTKVKLAFAKKVKKATQPQAQA